MVDLIASPILHPIASEPFLPVASRKNLFEGVFVASLKIYPKGIAKSGGKKHLPEEWQPLAQHPQAAARKRFSHPARFPSFLLLRSQFEQKAILKPADLPCQLGWM